MAKAWGLESLSPKIKGSPRIKAALQKEMNKAYDVVKKAMKLRLDETVRTWNGKPVFILEVVERRGSFFISAYTRSKVWNWVNQGTKAHMIFPRRVQLLAFQRGYLAKTQVGRISSRNGARFGPRVYAKGVKHPGFPARNFSGKIEEQVAPILAAETQAAILRVQQIVGATYGIRT
jgi:hypothetical protein